MNRGIILYGPPAAGKDTVTAALKALDSRYVLFPRLKAGPGRTAGYRMTTPQHLDELRRTGGIVWENERYGARYAIDFRELTALLSWHVPVVHLGQVPAIEAVQAATLDARWLLVYLWCPREEATCRLVDRGTGDLAERLHAWDDTEAIPNADLTIDTSRMTPSETARTIHDATTKPACRRAPQGRR